MKTLALCIVRRRQDVTPQTVESLHGFRGFERDGIRVMVSSCPWLLEDARNVGLARAFAHDFDAVLQWDSDIVGDATQVWPCLAEAEQGTVVAGLFQRNGGGDLAATGLPSPLPTTPFRVRLIGGGCMLITRQAYERVAAASETLIAPDGSEYPDVFGRLVVNQGVTGKRARASEIYSFCLRCEAAGVPVLADPRFALGHARRDEDTVDWYHGQSPNDGGPQESQPLAVVHSSVVGAIGSHGSNSSTGRIAQPSQCE